MSGILRCTKVRILALEVGVILAILTIHAATGLQILLRPVLFILGLLVGVGMLYLLWSRLVGVMGEGRMSGSRFVSWYFALQIISGVLIIPVLFLMGLSAPLTAFALGFVVAVTYSLWGRLLLSTPFFGEDEGLRAGAGTALNVALVVGGALISLYLLAGGGYVLIEYVLGPTVRFFA